MFLECNLSLRCRLTLSIHSACVLDYVLFSKDYFATTSKSLTKDEHYTRLAVMNM